MTPTQQKLAAAALGLVCAAVWAPQALRRLGADPSSAQAPAGPSPEEMAEMTALVSEAPAPLPGTPTPRPPGAGPGETLPRPDGDPRAQLGELVSNLQNFGVGAPPRSLDQVAVEWSQGAAPDPSAASGEGAVASADALDGFLAANPLRATFLFADGAVALLGPHQVRVGDELLDGEAVVTRIEARTVGLSLRGIPREVQLPPLRAQAVEAASQRSAGDLPPESETQPPAPDVAAPPVGSTND